MCISVSLTLNAYIVYFKYEDQWRQGCDRPIIANSKTAAVSESLDSGYLGLT